MSVADERLTLTDEPTELPVAEIVPSVGPQPAVTTETSNGAEEKPALSVATTSNR